MRHVFVAGALLFTLVLVPAATGAQAPVQKEKGLSIGPIMSDPTDATLRGGLDERSAIPAHLKLSPHPGNGADDNAEWFTSKYDMYEDNRQHDFHDQSHFGPGARGGLAGLRASFVKASFDLFLELVPVGISFVVPNPVTYYNVDLALGIRYRF